MMPLWPMDPVHERDGVWYYWDETWAGEVGPFITEGIARTELRRYIHKELAPAKSSEARSWVSDCLHWRGHVLWGRHGHWCYDWDSLPVDETTGEIACCTCYSPAPGIRAWLAHRVWQLQVLFQSLLYRLR